MRLAVGTALALLAYGLFAPPAARASCGHYVVIGSQTGRGALPAMQPSHADDSLPAAPAAPCSGPRCSGRTPVPLTAPPAPVRTPDQSLADALSCVLLVETGPTGLALEDGSRRPVRRTSTIYHPPR
jgi:hypothetical protein